jgi:prephenate dehydratase
MMSEFAASHPTSLPRVAFQGALGAFSELAIRQQWPDGADVIPCDSFDDAIACVLTRRADLAVIPTENAIAGRVLTALAALDDAGDRLQHHGEIRVPIHLCLMAPHGASLAELRVVRSHPVALAQCRIFFARHGWLVPEPHADTAGAALEVAQLADRTVGAVAGEAAAVRYGLDIIARSVEDVPANWTRFVIVSER